MSALYWEIGEIANAFLIPALDSENVENQNYGEVPYWTVQHSGFSELPTVQVIKLNPQKVWNCYLGKDKETDSIFNLIQKSPTKNYLYHNKNDESIIQINNDKKHILVGFLREEYFNHVIENFDELGNTFLFYFYSTGIEKESRKFVRYPLHPYIDSCTEIILFTKDKSQFIQGQLSLTKTGRCKIDELPAKNLENELKKQPCSFIKQASNARTYYVMTVENAKMTTEPYTNICNYDELVKKNKRKWAE